MICKKQVITNQKFSMTTSLDWTNVTRMMHPIKQDLTLEEAIIHTLAYSDLFDFPMALEELHRYLFFHETSIDDLEKLLKESSTLQKIITHRDGFYCLQGRGHLIELRKSRMKKSRQLWGVARRYASVFSKIPFIKFIGITGSLAAENVQNEKDDIDLFLITEKNRLWLSHALLRIIALALERLYGIKPCHNYIITEDQMHLINRRTLYTARELVQMIPIYGKEHYELLKNYNEWAFKIFPNSRQSERHPFFVDELDYKKRFFPRLMECVLRTPLGDVLDYLEWRRMRKKIMLNHFSGNEAYYSKQVFKDHRNNHGNKVLRRFQERLEEIHKQLDDLKDK